MPNLSAVDWMIVLIYFFFVISIGLSLRQFIAKRDDFVIAGRALPAWLCGFAFAAASLGSLEVLGMGAAGARYGLVSASFFSLGSVVPLLFAGLFMTPVYYAATAKGARSVPGYLGLRFDARTRTLNAILFLAIEILGAALALYVMARIFAALGLFNILFHAQTVGSMGVLIFSVALPAALVLIYVTLGGLGATMYAQVMQFFILIAAFLPLVLMGLKQAGGWTAMKASFTTALTHATGSAPAAGGTALAAAALLGAVLTAGYWCTNPGLLQTAMAAENAGAARRAPLIAAAARVLLPFLLILPGIIAIGMPTPHTTELIRTEGGAIYHEISVVPEPAEKGQGLIPARTDSPSDLLAGKILRDKQGHALLNYAMATPNLLPYNLPTGLIGLAITALLACLTGGVAARIAAIGTIFTCDLFEPHARNTDAESRSVSVARWTTAAAVLLAAALACVAMRMPMPGLLDLLALTFAVLYAPMLVTFLLGMFWKRATAAGAFAGSIAGFAAALAHYGLTVPQGEMRGVAGGWLVAAPHQAHGILAQNMGTALCGMLANLIVAAIVTLFTAPRPQAELTGLVYSLTPAIKPTGLQPAVLAGIVLLAAIAVSLIFF